MAEDNALVARDYWMGWAQGFILGAATAAFAAWAAITQQGWL